MKHLPKSKLGAVAAGAYLLPVFGLLATVIFGSGGLHGSAAMAFLFAIILTVPLSLPAVWLIDSLPAANALKDFLAVGILAVCAVVNAAVIYLAVGFLSQISGAFLKRLSNKNLRSFFLIPVMAAFFSISGWAQTGTFESVGAFQKSVLKPSDKLFEEVRGDLNGDGLEDWAGMIEREKTGGMENGVFKTSQIYILLRQNQGGYRLAAQSKEEIYSEGGGALYEGMEIKNSSLYLSLGSKTYATHKLTTYQFKLYRDSWRLIGVKVFYLVMESDKSIESDINLLTGKIIEKRQTGGGKPAVKRRNKKFPVYLLKDFDFYLEDFQFDYGGYGMENQ